MKPPVPPVDESSPLYPVNVAYFYARARSIGLDKGADHATSWYHTHFEAPSQELRAKRVMLPW